MPGGMVIHSPPKTRLHRLVLQAVVLHGSAEESSTLCRGIASRRGSRALAVAQPLPSATALSKTRRASFQQGAPLGSPYYGARTALLRNARPRSRAIGYRKPKSGFQQPIRARPRPEAQAFLDKSGRGGQGLLFCRKSPGQACSTAWDGLGTWASSWVNGAGGGRRGLGADPLGSGIDASGQGQKMLGSWVG